MSVATNLQPQPVERNEDEIKVRRMDFEFGDDIPEFWFDNNPFLAALLTSMSVSFPAGERYFIDSVRYFQKRITDPKLLKNIRAFIGQEGHHTKEHLAFNEMMERKGYPAKAMEKWVEDRIAWIQNRSSPEANLARTAALEHFTAIMAGAFLDHPEVLDRMDPALAKIWAWHAIEEVEHRSVAFDVYRLMVDDEKLRRRVMMQVTYFFILVNTVRTVKLLGVSGNTWNLKAWGKGLNMLWGRPGMLRKIIPQYLSYYRKGFHPSQHDNRTQVERARQKYLGDKA